MIDCFSGISKPRQLACVVSTERRFAPEAAKVRERVSPCFHTTRVSRKTLHDESATLPRKMIFESELRTGSGRWHRSKLELKEPSVSPWCSSLTPLAIKTERSYLPDVDCRVKIGLTNCNLATRRPKNA
jgi:hypothetical protein